VRGDRRGATIGIDCPEPKQLGYTMEYVHLVILLALVEYIFFVGIVGGARGKFNVEAPAVTGDPRWERLFRIQQNTAEQLILFIPGVLAFAHYVSPLWAAIVGAVFVVGRLVYYVGYKESGDKRAPGVLLSIPPNIVLVVGALIGLVMDLF
jgi:glutathione S-transferase